MNVFSHYVYVLHNYALAPLPRLTELCISFFFKPEFTSGKHRWRSTPLAKLQVVQRRSGALRLTLTTACVTTAAELQLLMDDVTGMTDSCLSIVSVVQTQTDV